MWGAWCRCRRKSKGRLLEIETLTAAAEPQFTDGPGCSGASPAAPGPGPGVRALDYYRRSLHRSGLDNSTIHVAGSGGGSCPGGEAGQQLVGEGGVQG